MNVMHSEERSSGFSLSHGKMTMAAVLIAALIACCAMFILNDSDTSSAANSGPAGDNCTWTYDESTHALTITGTGDMYDYDWSAEYAPWDVAELYIETVEIGEGITRVGDSSFRNNSSVSSVSLPSTLTSIGDRAFAGVYDATSIYLPSSLVTIGERAFYDCAGLGNVDLPNVTSIGAYAFAESKIESLNITTASGVTIDPYAFYYCSSVTSLTIRTEGDVVLGNGILNKAWYFRNFSIEGADITINGNDLSSSLIMEFHLSASGTLTMSANATDGLTFYDVDGETVLEKTPENLNNRTFKGMPGKLVLDAPTSGTSGDCEWSMDLDTGVFTVSGTGAMADNETQWDSIKSRITAIIIEEGVTEIGAGAFSGCTSIEYAEFASTITYVGEDAFEGTVFYESDGVDIVEPTADNLAGRTASMIEGKLCLSEEPGPSPGGHSDIISVIVKLLITILAMIYSIFVW